MNDLAVDDVVEAFQMRNIKGSDRLDRDEQGLTGTGRGRALPKLPPQQSQRS